MLEVCFNDSTKCSLVLAQRCKNNIRNNPVAYVTGKKSIFSFFKRQKAMKEYRERELKLQQQAVALEGKKEDIVGVSFSLSQGDISSAICLEDCPRKDYISSMFLFDRFNQSDGIEASINKFWTNCIEDLEKLKCEPESIRVWLDYTPDAQCGLLFIADLLKDSCIEIHIVELPEKIVKNDNHIVEYRGWGEVDNRLFGTFLDREKILTQEEIIDLADRWKLLQKENAPLRVVEDNLVISADISYYDDLIKKEFPQDTCKVAQIIGNALSKQKILTGDVFIAKRIQHFIDNGELAVLGKTDDGFYSTVVSCAK
ncbi:MAG: DUF3658 domain-containing protein [Oscillospiraceae bacterium]